MTMIPLAVRARSPRSCHAVLLCLSCLLNPHAAGDRDLIAPLHSCSWAAPRETLTRASLAVLHTPLPVPSRCDIHRDGASASVGSARTTRRRSLVAGSVRRWRWRVHIRRRRRWCTARILWCRHGWLAAVRRHSERRWSVGRDRCSIRSRMLIWRKVSKHNSKVFRIEFL